MVKSSSLYSLQTKDRETSPVAVASDARQLLTALLAATQDALLTPMDKGSYLRSWHSLLKRWELCGLDQSTLRGLPHIWVLEQKWLQIIEELRQDAQAVIDKDPVQPSLAEIAFAYPGMQALMAYRLAHSMRSFGLHVLARLWSNEALKATGIDIHPAATIGPGFFIDHGTGVVVGEHCTIGCDVTIFHGVTLGAKQPLKGNSPASVKRHPTIGNSVTLYAYASVLGGDTEIGDGSVVGYGVQVTESLPPGSQKFHSKGSTSCQK